MGAGEEKERVFRKNKVPRCREGPVGAKIFFFCPPRKERRMEVDSWERRYRLLGKGPAIPGAGLDKM